MFETPTVSSTRVAYAAFPVLGWPLEPVWVKCNKSAWRREQTETVKFDGIGWEVGLERQTAERCKSTTERVPWKWKKLTQWMWSMKKDVPVEITVYPGCAASCDLTVDITFDATELYASRNPVWAYASPTLVSPEDTRGTMMSSTSSRTNSGQ